LCFHLSAIPQFRNWNMRNCDFSCFHLSDIPSFSWFGFARRAHLLLIKTAFLHFRILGRPKSILKYDSPARTHSMGDAAPHLRCKLMEPSGNPEDCVFDIYIYIYMFWGEEHFRKSVFVLLGGIWEPGSILFESGLQNKFY
jgi:hypothetical protein